MTLVLSDSIRVQGSVPDGNVVEVKANGPVGSTNYREKSPPEAEIRVGDCYLSMEDFCDSVRYVFENTDLEDDDPRLKLWQDLLCAKRGPGYNKDCQRIYINS